MNKKNAIRAAGVIGMALVLQACIVDIGDSGRGWKEYRRPPTVGEQLEDLRKARDDGLLTQSEYEQVRERIISSDIQADEQ